MRELRLMLALPPEPLMWLLLVVSGVFAVAFVFEQADVPRTLRRGIRQLVRWRDPR